MVIKSFVVRVTVALLVIFSGGCQLFSPVSDSTRLFYICTNTEKISATAVNRATIRVELRHFPEYLERPFLVTKIGPNEYKEHPKFRWAMPLRDNVLRSLSECMCCNYPQMTIYIWPKDVPKAPDIMLTVDVSHFWVDEKEQQVLFSGRWSYCDLGAQSCNENYFEFCAPFTTSGDEYTGVAAAIEQVLRAFNKSVIQKMDLFLVSSERT